MPGLKNPFIKSNSSYMPMETDGNLTQYVFQESMDDSQEEIGIYFSEIPNYNGSTVPNVLNRTRTLTPNDSNYYFFSNFLYNLSQYGKENTWIVACILSLTRPTERFGFLSAAARTFGEGTINKQIICKRVGNTVVCIINVTDSEKIHGDVTLHHLFQGKILTIDYSPSITGNNADSFIVKVYSYTADGNIQEYKSIVDPPTMGTLNPKPTQLTVSGLKKILSPKRAIVVADPNKVLDQRTIIVGFGNKTISEINGIVDKIMPMQPEEEAESAASSADVQAHAHVSGPKVSSGGNRMKKTKSKLKKRRRSRRHRPKTTRKLKKKAHKHSRRRSVRSCYKK
jgi:hypothetical protein